MAKKKNKSNKADGEFRFASNLEKAWNFFNRKNYERAAACCEQAMHGIEKNVDKKQLARLYFIRALSLFKLNDYRNLDKIISAAENDLGHYLDSGFFKIMRFTGKGEWENVIKAVEDYSCLRKETGGKTDEHLMLSQGYLDEILWLGARAAKNLSRMDRAADFMERSLSVKPDNHLHRIELAELLAEFNQSEKALAVIEDGIEKYPDILAFKNLKGVILGRLERFDEALEYIQDLLLKYPNDGDALNNLGVIYEKQGKYESAKNYFEKALKAARNNVRAKENIEFINNNIDPDPQSISACMIVKNEEKFLPGCLASIKGLVDETIIVDTGSTDRTMDIARQHDAKIYEHPWQNDFSYHRNQSMSYATGDWILIVDADEELDPDQHERIRALLKRKDVDGLSFVVFNEINFDRVGCLTSKRIFRNHKGYHYEGIVHNQLRMDGKVLETSFKVIHHGYALSDEDMQKKARRSEELLLKQVEENPDYLFAHFNLAQLYRGQDNFEKCLKHSRIVVDKSDINDPKHRHLHLMALDQLGCSYFGTGDYEKAIATLKKALEFKNDYLDPLFNLGFTFFHIGKYEEAETYYRKYLEVKKTYAPQKDAVKLMLNNLTSEHIAYYMIGYMKMLKQDYDSAIENFNHSLGYLDNVRDIHKLLAGCYRMKGDYPRVIEHCASAISHNYEDAEIRLMEGEALLKSGDQPAAQNSFNRALELKPDSAETIFAITGAVSLNQDPAEALGLIDRYLEKMPGSARGLASRGDVLFKLGNFSLARQNYEDSFRQNPGDYAVLNNLGNCFLKSKNYSSAETCYRLTLEKNSEYAAAYRNLAISLIKQNKADEGLQYLIVYLGKNPQDGEVHATIGDIYYNNREYENAIRHYEKFLNFFPDSVNALIRLSDCYFNLCKYQAAALGYQAVLQKNPHNKIVKQRLQDLDAHLQLSV
jgi:tetratricopeptide (TPR) repeat protein